MSKGKMEIIEVVPGSGIIQKLVQRFGRNQYGIVTTLGDQGLSVLNEALEDDTLVDIKSFGELVRQIHRLTGYPTRRIASARQIESAIRVTCQDLKPNAVFRKVAEFHGFHQALRSSIRELEHWGLQPSSLAKLAVAIGGGTATKLREISEIWEELYRLLEEVNSTTVSMLIQECLDEDIEFDGQDSRIMVFVSNTLHPLALKWLQWLAEQGSEVTLVCERHATDGTVFEACRTTSECLGMSPNFVGEANDLLKNLFAKTPSSGARLNNVEVHVAGEPLAECEWALRHWLSCQETETGAILVRDLDKYGSLLVAAAKRLKVPIQVRRRVPLLSNGFAKVTLQLLQAMAANDVREFAKPFSSSYTQVPASQSEWLREAHAHRGSEWQQLTEIVSKAKESEPDGEYSTFEYLLKSRVEAKIEAKTYVAWHSYLRQFLEDAPWFAHLMGSRTEGRDQRAFTSMLSSAGQDASLADAYEKEPISFERWVRYLEKLWDSSDVSLPTEEEGIQVVSSPDQLGNTSQLYVLGMIEGSFPRRRSEDPILTDEEKQLISNHFIDSPRMEDSFAVAKRERDLFYKVCASTTSNLYFSYPMPEGESDSITAFYLQEVKRICAVTHEELHGRRVLVPDEGKCLSESDISLYKALNGKKSEPPDNELKHADAIAVTTFDFTDVQPRQLRTLKECNFRFTAERTLPLPKANRDYFGSVIRIPDRAGLLTIETPEKARQTLQEEAEKLIDDLRPQLQNWELELIEKGAMNLVSFWVQREFESRELWNRNPSFTQIKGGFGTDPLLRERFKYQFEGPVAGVTTENGIRTVHLYRRNVPKETKEEKRRQYLLDYAAYFSAAWHGVREVRVEVEGMSDTRTLLLFCPDGYLPPRKDEMLLTINLAINDGSPAELAEFVRSTLAAPKQLAISGKMPPNPDEHCTFCSYSELCRVSRIGGEDVDPFADLGGTSE